MNGWTENNNFNEYRIRNSSFNSSIQNNSSEDNSRQDNLSQENSSLTGFKPRSDIKLHLEATSFESTDHYFVSTDEDMAHTSTDESTAEAFIDKMYARHILLTKPASSKKKSSKKSTAQVARKTIMVRYLVKAISLCCFCFGRYQLYCFFCTAFDFWYSFVESQSEKLN